MSSRFGGARDINQDPATDHSEDGRVETFWHGVRQEAAPNDSDDIALVRQLQSGNHDALTSLFERYSGMVFSIARRMLRNSGEAEEVVQQVFLDTYKAINQFDPTKASYKTWLFQFAYHRTINRKKHLEAKGFYSTQDLDEMELPVELYEGAGRMLRLSPQEVSRLVHQVLDTIDTRQRETIQLTFFQGLTAEEIARRTGETPAAVRHHLYRGLAKLRSALLTEKPCNTSQGKGEVEGILLADPARTL